MLFGNGLQEKRVKKWKKKQKKGKLRGCGEGGLRVGGGEDVWKKGKWKVEKSWNPKIRECGL